jgi:hypothetical protein
MPRCLDHETGGDAPRAHAGERKGGPVKRRPRACQRSRPSESRGPAPASIAGRNWYGPDVVKPLVLLPFAVLMLAGCASPGRYPSLGIRDAERATGTLEPAEAEPYVPPATPAATLDRLGTLSAQAQAAHQAFLAAADKARAPVAAARGAAEGSDRWSVAQVALADLEASRSQAMIALADLDRLYVDATLEAAELTRIADARDEVGSLVEGESRLIAELQATLGS